MDWWSDFSVIIGIVDDRLQEIFEKDSIGFGQLASHSQLEKNFSS
jgi:hypothetical protein